MKTIFCQDLMYIKLSLNLLYVAKNDFELLILLPLPSAYAKIVRMNRSANLIDFHFIQ